ncbi:MAG: hypothetical protein K0S55_1545 [Clostridia bacterium]|nr:hypothetical protein [Clostridia bacterium]
MKAYVKKEGDGVNLYIDEKPVVPLCYTSYNYKKEFSQDFYDNNVNIHTFAIYFNDLGINSESWINPFKDNIWKGEGLYDFSVVDSDLAEVPKGNNVYLLPRINVDPPKWWLSKYPEEAACDYSGVAVRQSFASRRWKKEAAALLIKLIDYLENNNLGIKVIGYHIAFGRTEECFPHKTHPQQLTDYSKVYKEAYEKWYIKKYGDKKNFKIPNPFERRYCKNGLFRTEDERFVVDYYKFYSLIVTQAISYFADIVKMHTGGARICGSFYGYNLFLHSAECAAFGLAQLLNDNSIDFLSSPNSYYSGRTSGNDWPFMSTISSVALHNKLWFTENDTRTCLTHALIDSIPEASPVNPLIYGLAGVWKGPGSIEESLSHMQKTFYRSLCYGVGSWWFDMWGGWYQDSKMLEFVNKSKKLYEKQIEKGYSSVTEIAVFIDEDSILRYNADNIIIHEMITKQVHSLGTLGAPYDTYLIDDLLNPSFNPDKYKLFIFLGCIITKIELADYVDKKLKRNEKTLLWVCCYNKYISDFDFIYDGISFMSPANYEGVLFPANATNIQCEHMTLKSFDGVRILLKSENGEPAVIHKYSEGNNGGWNSIYSSLPDLPASYVRLLATYAGVHIYNRNNDVIYANNMNIAIHAACEGYKRIYLRKDADIYDAITGELLTSGSLFEFYMNKFETKLFEYKFKTDNN